MRRRGFSLTELSFVVTIMLILSGVVAGGGSYLINQANYQKAIENALELRDAVERYMQRAPAGNIHCVYPPYAWSVGSGLMGELKPHIKNSNPAQARQFLNPYTGTLQYPVAVRVMANGAYPTVSADTPQDFSPASYPNTVKAHAGRVLYFNKMSSDPRDTLSVWDGTQTKTFNLYGIQVVDDRGEPLITLGR